MRQLRRHIDLRPAGYNFCHVPTACPPAQPIGPIPNRSASAHLDAAQKIRDEHGATLDWLYRAHRSMVPHHLAIEIARIEAAEQEF